MDIVSSSATLKRLCASWLNSHRHRQRQCNNINIIKVEHFDTPRVLTRKETEDFLIENSFTFSNDPKVNQNIVNQVASQSKLLLVVRSDLFRAIDDPFCFQCLDEIYKKILQELIIESHWGGLITFCKNLAIADHLVLIKDVDTARNRQSLNALFEMLQMENKFEMIKIEKIAEGNIEKLVLKNHGLRCGMFTKPPNGVAIKLEEDNYWS